MILPYLVCKKSETNKSNAFYKKCAQTGEVCVICRTRTKKADIQFDANILSDGTREYFKNNSTELEAIAQEVYEEFDRPKVSQRSLGFIISFNDISLDIAEEVSAVLTTCLEALISSLEAKVS